MVHAGALPGTPRSAKPVGRLAEDAAAEAEIYRRAGFDAVLVENMHDLPYPKAGSGPEIVAAMTLIGQAVKSAAGLPCGMQILAAANREALAAACAAGLDFIRVEGFVFAHVADEGLVEGCAAELMRYRRQIGAGRIQVIADIKKKHSSHSITADTDIAETARAAEFFLADGLVVTGPATASATSLDDLRETRAATELPVAVGSGVTAENAARYLEVADALIVGSDLKEGGDWRNPVSAERAARFMESVAR